MFATIDIPSTIIIFNSDKVNLNCVLFWSDIGGAKSPDSLGIDKAVCIVVPLILGTLSSFVEDENKNKIMTWHALGHWDENIVFGAKIES